jgi:hypothetical protein
MLLKAFLERSAVVGQWTIWRRRRNFGADGSVFGVEFNPGDAQNGFTESFHQHPIVEYEHAHGDVLALKLA